MVGRSKWKAMARAGAVYPTLVGPPRLGRGSRELEGRTSCGRISRPCGNRVGAGRPRRHRRHKNDTPMTTSPSPRPPLPPFDCDAAIQKVRLAENTWNTCDPARVGTLLTRRQILASGVAMAVTVPFRPITRATAATEPRTAKLRLTAGIRTLAVNGKPARVFGLIGPDGKPGITLSPGERFHVDLVNRADTSTIIHWHGQLPPWTQDGFPWPQTPPIPAGETRSYDYAPIPGTFWMHAHQGLQEQNRMTAPLIVHSAEDLRADRQDVVLLLNDFSFRTPDELLAGLTNPDSSRSAMPMSHGRTTTNGSGSMGAMNMSAMGMGPDRAPDMAPDVAPDLNDIDYDAFLAND